MTRTALSLEPYRQMLDEPFRAVLESIRPEFLRAPLTTLLATGKRLRPITTLLACEAAGGKPEEALEPSLGVELLHAASLVHDDMMDRASFRRGHPTVHARYGMNAALLCGDYLVALAYERILRAPSFCRERLLPLANQAYRALCEGQALEESLNGASFASRETLLAIMEKKTGSLMAFAAGAGALAGGASEADYARLLRFGQKLGIAFQIQDDILDAAGDPRETGKDPGLDAKNRKVNLVILSGTEAAGREAELLLGEALHAVSELPPGPGREKLLDFIHLLQARRM